MMNEKENAYNNELLKISKFRALMIEKHTLSILLIIFLVTAMFMQQDSLVSFYILAANNLFPVFISIILTDHTKTTKKEAETYLLPVLVKRYHYNSLQYKCNSVTFYLCCLFLYLWQQRMYRIDSIPVILCFYPLALLIMILLMRLAGSIFFYVKLKRSLLYNS